jgi:ThiF family
MHWIPIDLPFLERRAPSGFRQNELGRWFASVRGTLRPSAGLQWAESQNWHPDELATRGRLPTDLTAARTLLIGAGALGSVVGELLVRSGIINVTVVDAERLVAGNLVRHTLTAEQIGQFKADAVAARLNVASPSAVAIAEPKLAESVVSTAYLAAFELVIDTTGDHRILELLAEVPASRSVTYVSVAVTLHARRLIAYLSRGTRFPLNAFDAAFEPYRQDELERDEERPMEGIGCWHPVFPARADEMALMASTAIGLLDDTWPIAEGSSALHVFERQTDEQGRFGGVLRISQ